MMKEYLKEIIREAGNIAKKHFQEGVSHTSKAHLGDLITVADNEVSDFIISKIKEKFPLHTINSEEVKDTINPGHEYEWVIDPIDGTRNFANGVSFWCIMVAVLKDDELYMSAIYNPLGEELFFAQVGKGATLNGLPLEVNKVDSLDHGFGFICRGTNTQYEKEFITMITRVAEETSVWMHNYGSVLGACYLASGGVDFFAENCGYDYDYLAVALICQEAGAMVTDIDGNPWKRDRRDIVVANPKLHPKVLQLFK